MQNSSTDLNGNQGSQGVPKKGGRPPGGSLFGGKSGPLTIVTNCGKVQERYAEIYSAGRMMKVHRKDGPGGKPGKRGVINKFTAGTKRRMMFLFAKVKRMEDAIFATLTFPDEFYPNNQSPGECKRLINNMIDRLEYAYPDLSAIWRREHMLRKSGKFVGIEWFPHYHFIVWGVVDWLEFQDWMAQNWWEVCGRLSDEHLWKGSFVSICKSEAHASAYMQKYVSKVNDYDAQGWGRWWGLVNRQKIPFGQPVKLELTDSQAVKLLRLAKRKAGVRRNLQSFTLVTDHPEQWLHNLPDICELEIDR